MVTRNRCDEAACRISRLPARITIAMRAKRRNRHKARADNRLLFGNRVQPKVSGSRLWRPKNGVTGHPSGLLQSGNLGRGESVFSCFAVR